LPTVNSLPRDRNVVTSRCTPSSTMSGHMNMRTRSATPVLRCAGVGTGGAPAAASASSISSSLASTGGGRLAVGVGKMYGRRPMPQRLSCTVAMKWVSATMANTVCRIPARYAAGARPSYASSCEDTINELHGGQKRHDCFG
jgi:hypothetical protein